MKKLRLKKIWIILIVCILLISAYPTIQIIRISFNNYSFLSSIKILNHGYKNKALKNKYSKTFEIAINSSDFIDKNANYYLNIDYYNRKDFIKSINSLIKIGYSTKDINLINKNFNDSTLADLVKSPLIKDISEYMKFDYFKSENLNRYIKYYDDDYKKAVVNVNIGLDTEFYTNAKTVKNFSIGVLANKYNKLDEAFEPNNLMKIKSDCSKNESYLQKEAAEAFENMCNDAKKEKRYILSNSAYRSYKSQNEIYNTYLKTYGQSYVNNYVATPGYSEHQTGLAVDVASKSSNIFENSNEYKWMIENAYKYGYILRYPKDKEKITGYKNEAWHFRYVGINAAKYIKENNITYDEYYIMFLDK